MLWYTVVPCETVYLDDGLWVWQCQSEHSGGSSKQHHNMSTPDLLYADLRQHRAQASQDQLESIVRKVCVQRDLQQSQNISLIMPVNEFENSVKWFKLPPRQKRLAQRWSLPVSAAFTNVCLTLRSAVFMLGDYHVVLYTTESHSLPCQNIIFVHGFQMPIKHLFV